MPKRPRFMRWPLQNTQAEYHGYNFTDYYQHLTGMHRLGSVLACPKCPRNA